MKHLLTFLLVGMIGLLSVNNSYSQAVDDRAVVPVSVTLNSILRLNVESGGNVEFNFNTLEQYQNGISGIGTDDQYSTHLTVASSVNYNLEMAAEDDGLTSTDTVSAGASMSLDYITYQVTLKTSSGFSEGTELTIPSDGTPTQLSTSADIVQNAGGNAGGVTDNAFRVDWACGSTADNAHENLMGSPLTGGRYSTNVFFILKPAN